MKHLPKLPKKWLSTEGWDFLSFWIGMPFGILCTVLVLSLLFR